MKSGDQTLSRLPRSRPTARATVAVAQRACEAMGARQAVVVAFDGTGTFSVASYGVTQRECRDLKRTCDAIADALLDGRIPAPESA